MSSLIEHCLQEVQRFLRECRGKKDREVIDSLIPGFGLVWSKASNFISNNFGPIPVCVSSKSIYARTVNFYIGISPIKELKSTPLFPIWGYIDGYPWTAYLSVSKKPRNNIVSVNGPEQVIIFIDISRSGSEADKILGMENIRAGKRSKLLQSRFELRKIYYPEEICNDFLSFVEPRFIINEMDDEICKFALGGFLSKEGLLSDRERDRLIRDLEEYLRNKGIQSAVGSLSKKLFSKLEALERPLNHLSVASYLNSFIRKETAKFTSDNDKNPEDFQSSSIDSIDPEKRSIILEDLEDLKESLKKKQIPQKQQWGRSPNNTRAKFCEENGVLPRKYDRRYKDFREKRGLANNQKTQKKFQRYFKRHLEGSVVHQK